jgi:hypothetical protein
LDLQSPACALSLELGDKEPVTIGGLECLCKHDHPDVHHDHAYIRPADPENGGTSTGAAKRIANNGKLSDYSVNCYGAPVTPPQPTVLG